LKSIPSASYSTGGGGDLVVDGGGDVEDVAGGVDDGEAIAGAEGVCDVVRNGRKAITGVEELGAAGH
jgi:hypothetical protein